MKNYDKLNKMYSFKMCPYCSSKRNCVKDYIIKEKNVTSIKCRNYKYSKNKEV